MDERPKRRARSLLLGFSLLFGLATIAGSPLSGPDEPRVAGIAREMAVSGDYLVPHLNGVPFLEYPSVGYVPQALLLRAFGGPSEFLAQLPGALCGALAVMLTLWMGRVIGGESLGLRAGFLLQITVGFASICRRNLVDPVLVLWTTLSLAGFAAAWLDERRARVGRALFYLGMALGFLTKGLIGIALPSACALVFAIASRNARALARIVFSWELVAFFAPLALWAWALELRDGGESLREFLRQSAHRFGAASADHSAPPWFYLRPIWYLTLPGVALPFAALVSKKLGATWRQRLSLAPEFLFPAVAAATIFVGLSAASAKRVLYLAPIFPPLAVLFAGFWLRLRPARAASPLAWRVSAAALLAATAALNFFVLSPKDEAQSFRSALEPSAERLDLSARPLVLYGPKLSGHLPSEGLQGAAYFYFGHVARVIRQPEELRALAASGERAIFVLQLDPDELDPLEDAAGSRVRVARETEVLRKSIKVYE